MELGIVAVIRTPTFELVAPVCEALLAGGVLAQEITMTVPDALRALREVEARFGNQVLLGAGTILNAAQAHAAIDAGAQYVISPVTKLEIIEAAHARNKPVMLGAYTPTEAQLAHEAGADFIKIFPPRAARNPRPARRNRPSRIPARSANPRRPSARCANAAAARAGS